MLQKKTGEADARIGMRLRAFRMLRGFSQEKLADLLGVTFQQVQKYEKGTNRISASRLLQACEALDVSLDQVTGSFLEARPGDTSLEPLLNAPDAIHLLNAYCQLNSVVSRKALVDLAHALVLAEKV
jgi:transcriptional regulator with XRE-family HTH domain